MYIINKGREEEGPEEGGDVKPQRGCAAVDARIAEKHVHILVGGEDAGGMFMEKLSLRGDCDFAAKTVEEFDVHHLFQLGDILADGRLAYAEGGRGLGEAALLSHRHENL